MSGLVQVEDLCDGFFRRHEAFGLDGILIGAGDLRFLAVAMVISIVVFVPLAIGVAVADLGVTWLWGALAVFMAARAVTLGLRFAGSAWLVPGADHPR